MKDFLSSEPKSLQEILNHSIKLNHLDDKLLFGKMINNWASIIGETISQKCELIALDKNLIRIKAINPQWRFELNLQKGKLLENVNNFSGCEHISEIEIL